MSLRPKALGEDTGAVDMYDQPLRVGDKVKFPGGKVVWTVVGGYTAAIDLSGGRRNRYYVKPYLVHLITTPAEKES